MTSSTASLHYVPFEWEERIIKIVRESNVGMEISLKIRNVIMWEMKSDCWEIGGTGIPGNLQFCTTLLFYARGSADSTVHTQTNEE